MEFVIKGLVPLVCVGGILYLAEALQAAQIASNSKTTFLSYGQGL